MKNEILIFQSKEQAERIEVRLEAETVWLNRQQMTVLFARDIKTIGKHINNIFNEGELVKESTVAKFATVQKEGDRVVERDIEYYNLDVIISVGYRVKSLRGTQFRIWANKILKEYLLNGYSINQRFNVIETDMASVKAKLNEIDFQLQTTLPPKEGIFYDGQVFDAYVFVSDIIRNAKKNIVLIDNYIDESVLSLLSKRKENVSAIIYSKNISKQTQLDIRKHNEQYPKIIVKRFSNSHDRFLIIDDTIIYHIGASIKDLGKKWFAFSRINLDINEIMGKLEAKV